MGDHEINDVWEDDLALTPSCVRRRWTDPADAVRIGYNEPPGDVILWIGVKPDSLSYEVGIDTALQCKRLLLHR